MYTLLASLAALVILGILYSHYRASPPDTEASTHWWLTDDDLPRK